MAIRHSATPTAAPSGSSRSPTDTYNFTPRASRSGLELPKLTGPGRLGRSNSTSSVTGTPGNFHRRVYDPELTPHPQRGPVRSANENGVTGMIEFLLNTEPPSDHFMSIPEHHDDRGRGWAKWASFSRSKSAPRNPPSIRLPDTAVSGTTIGGHRHIAITIPSQAFPMGEAPRSQYPVYSAPGYSMLGEKKPIPSPNGFYQTIINDKGTVTVLRTIDEQAMQQRPGRLTAQRNSRATPSQIGSTAARNSYPLPQSQGTGSDRQQRPRTSPQRFPARSSSRSTMSIHQPASIDSIIAKGDGSPKTLLDNVDDNYRRLSTAYLNKPLPKIKCTTSPQENNRDSGVANLPNNPLGPSMEKPAMASKVAGSRREKVRDRKQRDLEALLSLRKKRAQLAEDQDDLATGDGMQDAQQIGAPTLTPIKVVVDVEPSPAAEEEEFPPLDRNMLRFEPVKPLRKRSSDPGSATPSKAPNQERRAAEAPELTSDQTMPALPKKQIPSDRTALLRRREWNATRQQERKGKAAKPSVAAQAKRLAAEIDDPSNMQAVDREILRLYEAFREHRFREMEKRLRRLERNGDIWLRALVPALQGLHAGGVPRPDSAPVPGQEEADDTASSLYGSVSESEDLDALDAIEPLMRELAGAAAVRQMRSGRMLRAF